MVASEKGRRRRLWPAPAEGETAFSFSPQNSSTHPAHPDQERHPRRHGDFRLMDRRVVKCCAACASATASSAAWSAGLGKTGCPCNMTPRPASPARPSIPSARCSPSQWTHHLVLHRAAAAGHLAGAGVIGLTVLAPSRVIVKVINRVLHPRLSLDHHHHRVLRRRPAAGAGIIGEYLGACMNPARPAALHHRAGLHPADAACRHPPAG